MIKLQDFARQQGVTDRAVQKHLKTYAAELEGLFQRKGPNGTWLTEEACEILRSKMKQAPVAVMEPDERVGELMGRIKELEQRLERKDVLLTASQETAQKAQDRVLELQSAADKVKLLEGAQKALESERNAYKADAEAKSQELDRVIEAHQKEIAAAQAQLEARDKKIQELENRTFWQNLTASFRKKGNKQDGAENQRAD